MWAPLCRAYPAESVSNVVARRAGCTPEGVTFYRGTESRSAGVIFIQADEPMRREEGPRPDSFVTWEVVIGELKYHRRQELTRAEASHGA